jgi:hypothetical protein
MRLGLEALIGSDREEITIMSTLSNREHADLSASLADVGEALGVVVSSVGDMTLASFREKVRDLLIAVDCMAELVSDVSEDVTYHNAHHAFAAEAEALASSSVASTAAEQHALMLQDIADAQRHLAAVEVDLAARQADDMNTHTLALLKTITMVDGLADVVSVLRNAG